MPTFRSVFVAAKTGTAARVATASAALSVMRSFMFLSLVVERFVPCKTIDSERLERDIRPSVEDQLAHDGPDGRAELEAVAGESECMKQATRGAARSDDGNIVRCVAVDAG